MDLRVKPRLVWKVMEMAQEVSGEWERGDWMRQGMVVVVAAVGNEAWCG